MNKYIYKKSETYGEYNIYLPLSSYFTYNNEIIDCECVEEITEESVEIKTNRSFSLYENINPNFSISGDVTSYDTILEHINSRMQNTDFKSEIFKLKGDDDDDVTYYRIDMFEDTPDTTDTWAIINVKNDKIWDGRGNVPDEFIKDWCNNNTSEKYIRLKDINPYSLTYGKIIEQLKCC